MAKDLWPPKSKLEVSETTAAWLGSLTESAEMLVAETDFGIFTLFMEFQSRLFKLFVKKVL